MISVCLAMVAFIYTSAVVILQYISAEYAHGQNVLQYF